MSRLYGLDALRGIAALAVAVHHCLSNAGLPSPIAPFLAVDLFFILSGFVMARTYEQRMREGLTTPQFIAIRYRRLFVPLAVGITIGFLWALTFMGPHPLLIGSAILGLAFLPGLWPSNPFFINVPAWSLFLEILANAVHGALFSKLRMPALAAVCAACLGFFALTEAQWNYDLASILWLIPREFGCYLMGIIIFRVWGDRPLGNAPYIALAAFTGLLLLPSLNAWIAAVLCAPLIVRGSLALPRSPLASFVGALSYPLYAIHVPAMKFAVLLGSTAAIGLAALVSMLMAVSLLGADVKLRPMFLKLR